MKKFIILLAIAICIVTSAITDTMSIYTKTSQTIYGTITATDSGYSHYPLWDAQKELNGDYKINAIIQYNGKLYKRRNSGSSQNNLTPDNNRSWDFIQNVFYYP